MDFKEYWSNLSNIYKTDHFRLSHHIQPNSLPKYVTSLNELTSYSDFSMPGSTMDYELCSVFDIKNTYEGILKICVRPDLQVVIQIGAADPSEDCCKYLKFYLQCLQMVLEENG
jgi:pyoverdine/dityrosine biosynthesis protein Dit1